MGRNKKKKKRETVEGKDDAAKGKANEDGTEDGREGEENAMEQRKKKTMERSTS